jgi:membrane protein YqaA with SNARE-associated domain
VDDVSLLAPPIAFLILLAAGGLVYWLMGRLAPKKRSKGEGLEPYACGEDIDTHMIQPNYGQFLPFAFFFTILHVVALMVTTSAGATAAAFGIALLYVLGAAVGLLVLYRN